MRRRNDVPSQRDSAYHETERYITDLTPPNEVSRISVCVSGFPREFYKLNTPKDIRSRVHADPNP